MFSICPSFIRFPVKMPGMPLQQRLSSPCPGIIFSHKNMVYFFLNLRSLSKYAITRKLFLPTPYQIWSLLPPCFIFLQSTFPHPHLAFVIFLYYLSFPLVLDKRTLAVLFLALSCVLWRGPNTYHMLNKCLKDEWMNKALNGYIIASARDDELLRKQSIA